MLPDLLHGGMLHIWSASLPLSNSIPSGNSPMLVPLNTALAVSLVMPTDCTFTPGANISTAAPKFEKEALVSVDASMAPTVMAEAAEAGEVVFASIYFHFIRTGKGKGD
jgi:hypothetical protein